MDPVLRLEGLPYKVTEQELVSFFNDCTVMQIYLVKDREDRPTGLGFIEFAHEIPDVDRGMAKNDQNIPGHNRYMRANYSTREEMQWYLHAKVTSHIMEMSNLPYRMSPYEIACWLGTSGCCGVSLCKNEHGKNSGTADAFFLSEEDMLEVYKRKENNSVLHGRQIKLLLPPPAKFLRFFLLVGGFDASLAHYKLNEFFARGGSGVNCIKIIPRRGLYRGMCCALVEFKTEADMEEGLKKDRTFLDNQCLLVERWNVETANLAANEFLEGKVGETLALNAAREAAAAVADWQIAEKPPSMSCACGLVKRRVRLSSNEDEPDAAAPLAPAAAASTLV